MHDVFLSLGSNLGDRHENIKKALNALKNLCDTKLISTSNMYETEPLGVPDKQNLYINCCAHIQTKLSPHALLGACLGIESALGRKRTFKNAARVIDIDVLTYDDIIINTQELILPHPRMNERSFILDPLSEIKCNF